MKSPAEKSAAAKRQRCWKFYRVTPEENDAVEQLMREHPEYKLLLERGNLNDSSPALIFTDHDHNTGLIRGRLAYLINKALGVFESSYKERTPAILRALALYLEFPPAVMALGPRYGLIGRAKQKKKIVYGSANGPILPQPKGKKKKKTDVIP